MKTLLTDYSFDASAKTVTFTSVAVIDLSRLLLITNTTDNIIIYSFADPTKGGTVTGNILHLSYNTSSMSDSDVLQIFYDVTNYTIRLDDITTPNMIYIGMAEIGSLPSVAVWQIKRVDETTGLIITWADGDDAFDNIWNNRATTITYS
jgi:hypothetical protein